MSITEDVKVALRVTTDAMDYEIDAIVAAAMTDMARVGVPDEKLDEACMDPLAKVAVILYAKARFGYDNDEAARFDEGYRQIVADMLNSPLEYSDDY